jgi:hypothetical protein
VPTISNLSAPTAAEIAAGTEITAGISEISGFATDQDFMGTPDLASEVTAQVPGEVTMEDSSLKFYFDSASNPLRTTLAPGTIGNVVFIDYKPTGNVAASDKVDVYPAQIGSTPKERDMGAVAQWTANIAVTAKPLEDVTVA